MKTYLVSIIEHVEEKTSIQERKTKEIIQKSREILEDPKFINQKGIRSLVDEDARVGRKSKTRDFYDYKTEFVMTTDERIITSVRTGTVFYLSLISA